MDSFKPSDRPNLRGPLTAGLAVVTLFFGGFIGWAGTAPLSGGAVAPGSLVVEGQTKTVQHLEGGIVAKILVADNDIVDAGEPVLMLDDTQAKASLQLLSSRYLVAKATEARLVSERRLADTIAFPEEIASSSDPKIAEILEGQRNIFDARRRNQAVQVEVWAQRIAEYNEEIVGLEGQVSSETLQIELIDEEVGAVQTLFNKGFAEKPRLLQLKRKAAQIEGSRSQHKAQIARARQSISEAKVRIAETEASIINEVVEQLRTVQAELYDLEERIHAAEDVLRRTVVRAPASGAVVNLQVHTTGGVIAPGDALMDIVPQGQRLIVEAKVSPNDVDVVKVGLGAKVRFSALGQRAQIPVDALVSSVSADTVEDQTTGELFYLTRLVLQEMPSGLEGAQLMPGMQSEVLIVTEERTMLSYLFDPLIKSFNRSFKET